MPTPSISPEEAAAQMWEEAGVDPSELDAAEALDVAQQNVPMGPGSFGLRAEEQPQGPFTPMVYLVLGAFVRRGSATPC